MTGFDPRATYSMVDGRRSPTRALNPGRRWFDSSSTSSAAAHGAAPGSYPGRLSPILSGGSATARGRGRSPV